MSGKDCNKENIFHAICHHGWPRERFSDPSVNKYSITSENRTVVRAEFLVKNGIVCLM